MKPFRMQIYYNCSNWRLLYKSSLHNDFPCVHNDFHSYFHLNINTLAVGCFILQFPECLCNWHEDILKTNYNTSFCCPIDGLRLSDVLINYNITKYLIVQNCTIRFQTVYYILFLSWGPITYFTNSPTFPVRWHCLSGVFLQI